MRTTTLSITGKQHAELAAHLFPPDGCEAVAFALCGHRRGAERHRLVVRRVALVPYDNCSLRTPDRVTWSTDVLPPLLEEASRYGLGLVKIHGHRDISPFSRIDDASDRALFPSVHAWTEGGPHASAIMFPDGRMIGPNRQRQRALPPAVMHQRRRGRSFPSGHPATTQWPSPSSGRRVAQSFGSGTYDRLRNLRIGVVGCSGTGSPLIEQLARNCVGTLVLVGPGPRRRKEPQPNIERHNGGCTTRPVSRSTSPRAPSTTWASAPSSKRTPRSLFDPDTVRAVASCDVVFGCMDSIDGRHLLNKLATFYVIPYFDLGVKLEADGKGGVDQVCGTVHYLQPGGSSLLSRHVYTMEQVRAAGLYRTDPAAYRTLLGDGYIRGVQEDRPAVVQLNSLVASLAVNEFLARLHPYRLDPNGDYAIHRLSISHGIYEHEGDGKPCPMLVRHVGRGDVSPLLDWAELSLEREAA